MIENKTRQLEHDAKNLDFGREEEEETQTSAPTTTTTPSHHQSAKNTPVQKPAKKQAHTEEKSEKQPSKFLLNQHLSFLYSLIIFCLIKKVV